jgi:Trk K+ transport system NAD-binding subunit
MPKRKSYVISPEISHWGETLWGLEIAVEPLLAAVIAGFLIANASSYRVEFIDLLEKIAPPVYVAFFTVTGVTLKLDILKDTFLIALVLFFVRLVGTIIGASSGSLLSGDRQHVRFLWMAFISQAGVALGLSREIAAEFPHLGDEFATMLVAVIVLNEVIGPVFLRFALKISGESHLPEQAILDERRDVVIFGVDAQSLALARQLKAHRWQVLLVDREPAEPNSSIDGVEVQYLSEVNDESLGEIITKKTDAVVTMLSLDSDNLKVCTYVYDHFEGLRLIARLNDPTWTALFTEVGATVVNPTDAMITLLDQFVRAPQSAALFMHRNPAHEITQVTIVDRDFDNVPLRDLRLPPDVLILGITRDGHSIVPHGYTILKLNDEVILVGDPKQLEDFALQLGY